MKFHDTKASICCHRGILIMTYNMWRINAFCTSNDTFTIYIIYSIHYCRPTTVGNTTFFNLKIKISSFNVSHWHQGSFFYLQLKPQDILHLLHPTHKRACELWDCVQSDLKIWYHLNQYLLCIIFISLHLVHICMSCTGWLSPSGRYFKHPWKI